jgi:hypothetical protein
MLKQLSHPCIVKYYGLLAPKPIEKGRQLTQQVK